MDRAKGILQRELNLDEEGAYLALQKQSRQKRKAIREIAEAIGTRLGLPAVSVPVDAIMLPAYFGPLTNLVTLNLPASNLRTRETLGWEPAQPSLLADLDNGHYFPAN